MAKTIFKSIAKVTFAKKNKTGEIKKSNYYRNIKDPFIISNIWTGNTHMHATGILISLF